MGFSLSLFLCPPHPSLKKEKKKRERETKRETGKEGRKMQSGEGRRCQERHTQTDRQM